MKGKKNERERMYKKKLQDLNLYCWYVIDQDQDSLLVKRRNDNHSPGPVIRELVPSSHQRSELSNTILCIQRMRSENRGGHSNPW